MKLSNTQKGKIINWSATAFEVGVPLAVTATQFPMWVERSPEATISGLFVMFAFISAVPFFSQIKGFFKSPSAPIMWTIVFAVLMVLREIIDEGCVIAFFGMAANFVGSGVHKWGNSYLPSEMLNEKDKKKE